MYDLRPLKGRARAGPRARDVAAGSPRVQRPRERISGRWRVNKGPCKGFRNFTGQSCYRHAPLQALMAAPNFLNFLEDQGHPECPILDECVSCRLRLVAESYWRSGASTAQPDAMSAPLVALDKALRINGWHGTAEEDTQEDADEWLTFALRQAAGFFDENQREEYGKVVGVGLNSTIRCQTKGCTPKNGPLVAERDPALRLSILPETRSKTLKSYLNTSLTDKIDGYTCEQCGQTGTADQVQKISAAPEVLFVQLKRFDESRRKLTTEVRFGSNLNLNANVADKSQKPLVYKLAATVCHSETPMTPETSPESTPDSTTRPRSVDRSTMTGHYVAFAKASNGTWYECNDLSVRPVLARDVYSSAVEGSMEGEFTPYVLCYLKE
ncbi:MAG: hypothetical protein M4579_004767 [Chaenotheca gracillima]|nr:MAG: hypothetical protein M4579_004767 [Chaenotheca gracillima]